MGEDAEGGLMLISANIIKKPRARRICGTCHKAIEGPTLRLYGAAESSDPPWPLYIHPSCTTWDHPKVLKAKEQAA